MTTQPNSITEEILQDCVRRIAAGDPGGAYDFALTWIGHMPERKQWLDTYVADAFLSYAAKHGIADAEEYLNSTWPRLKDRFRERFGPQIEGA